MKLRNKKTGVHGEYKVVSAGYLIRVKDCNSDEAWQYDCLAGFNEDWEDYKPAEPLVEGMSQRAVLRAAARLSITNAATVQRSDIAEIVIFDFGGQCRVELKDRGINVKNRGVYSIEELCGEEE